MKPYVFEFVCVCVCVFCVCDVNIFKFSFVLDFVWFMFLIDPLENNLGVAVNSGFNDESSSIILGFVEPSNV